jgi:hypothetical protein
MVIPSSTVFKSALTKVAVKRRDVFAKDSFVTITDLPMYLRVKVSMLGGSGLLKPTAKVKFLADGSI